MSYVFILIKQPRQILVLYCSVSVSAKCCVTSGTAGGCKELQCASHWLLSGLCVLCVWCVEMVELSAAAAAGCTVALIMQVLQILGEKEDSSLPGSLGPEGLQAQAKEKADWLHILSVFVPVWTSFFPSLHWGKRFSSEPNLYSWASWGWRISLECL